MAEDPVVWFPNEWRWYRLAQALTRVTFVLGFVLVVAIPYTLLTIGPLGTPSGALGTVLFDLTRAVTSEVGLPLLLLWVFGLLWLQYRRPMFARVGVTRAGLVLEGPIFRFRAYWGDLRWRLPDRLEWRRIGGVAPVVLSPAQRDGLRRSVTMP